MLLAQDPELLLVDEPAAGMTDEETKRTGELLSAWPEKHSIIVVEHDMAFVKQIARDGQVTVLHQGTVLCEGKFDEVQANEQVRDVYLGRGKSHAMSSLLQLSGVEADIAGSRILRGVNLEVNAGEVVALMGRNGVGKTTTLRCITGLLPVRNGTVMFAGKTIAIWRRMCAPGPASGTCRKAATSFRISPSRRTCTSDSSCTSAGSRPTRKALERVFALFPVLKEMLCAKAACCPAASSNNSRLAARCSPSPKLLILDEPTEGIQPSIIDQIGDTLKKLKAPKAPAPVLERAADDVQEIKNAVQAAEAGACAGHSAGRAVRRFLPRGRRSFLRHGSRHRRASGAIATLTDEVVKGHLQV